MYDRMVVGGAMPVNEALKLEAIDPLKADFFTTRREIGIFNVGQGEGTIKVAESISSDYADKNPLFLAVLNGSFVFASDLVRSMTVPCEISFVKLASYQGTMSTGGQSKNT